MRRACASDGSPHWQLSLSKNLLSQSDSPRGLACSDHCTGKSAVKPTPISKIRTRTNKRRNALIAPRGNPGTSLKRTRGGVQTTSRPGLAENIGIQSYYIHFNQRDWPASATQLSRENRVWSKQANAQKDRSNHQLSLQRVESRWYNWTVIPINKLEISILDWSWKRIPIWFLHTNTYVLQELNGMSMSYKIVRHSYVG